MRGVSGVVGDDGCEVEYPAHIVPGQVEPRRLLEVLPGDVRLYRLPSHISKMVLLTVQSGPHTLTEERTFQHHFEITRPESKKKPKIVGKPKPKKEKPRKAPTPKRTPEEQREARRLHERARNRTPERREHRRRYAEEQRQKAKLLGKCQNCSKPAIPGQTRCFSCAEAHRQSPGRSYAERKAAAEGESTAME